jgi:enoyl-CoA hydratase/carnithine racemase
VKNHNLTESLTPQEIVVEQRPVLDRAGTAIPDLHNTWITLNNPAELNAYTTEMIKEIILALRAASNDRAAVAVVLHGRQHPRVRRVLRRQSR